MMSKMKSLDYMKPERFSDYVTISELAVIVGYDISWIRKLERRKAIPRAQRFKGVRLWSPEQVDEIKRFKSTQKPGRKKSGA